MCVNVCVYVCVCVCLCVHARSAAPSCPLRVTPWTAAGQPPLCVEQSRQECRSGLPSPLPGEPADPGTELTSPVAGSIPCFGTSWEAPALEINPPETAPFSQSVGSATLQTAPKAHTATGGGRVGRGYTNSSRRFCILTDLRSKWYSQSRDMLEFRGKRRLFSMANLMIEKMSWQNME